MELRRDRPRLHTRKFSKSVRLWLVVVVGLLAGVAGLMFSSITLLLKSEGWVSHSYQILDTLDLTEAYFSDAQSAERGYAATCNPTLLSPFNHDLPQIFAHVASLRRLAEDNPEQEARAVALGGALSAELERMSKVITTATGGNQQEAEAMLTRPDDARANGRIAGLINDMQAAERQLLAARLHNVSLFARTTLVSSAIGVIFIAAILFFVLRLIRRETARREGTEGSLQESNARLSLSLEELRRYNESTRAISLLGELLQTCQGMEEAVAIAARHLQEMFPGTAIAIALFNHNRDGVDVVKSLGDGALFAPHFRGSDCWALRRGRGHLSAPDGLEPACGHLEGPGAHALCVPLVAQGDTLGVLTVSIAAIPGEFERQTIQTVAEQLSLALANLKLQESLRFQSLRDPLTGLFNRRYLDEAVQREIARAGRHEAKLAMAMVDIDHFKRFNDTYGHEGGDALLSAFGRLLSGHARAEDIVCRYGGEEFAIILPGADARTAAARLESIRLAVKKLQVLSNGQPLGPVTLSAGIALFPDDGATGPMVLSAADAALYAAKHGGRDRVVCAGVAPVQESRTA